jgi:hypothetical protein
VNDDSHIGIPIAYPRLVFLEKMLGSNLNPLVALGKAGKAVGFKGFYNKFNAEAELLDDLVSCHHIQATITSDMRRTIIGLQIVIRYAHCESQDCCGISLLHRKSETGSSSNCKTSRWNGSYA